MVELELEELVACSETDDSEFRARLVGDVCIEDSGAEFVMLLFVSIYEAACRFRERFTGTGGMSRAWRYTNSSSSSKSCHSHPPDLQMPTKFKSYESPESRQRRRQMQQTKRARKNLETLTQITLAAQDFKIITMAQTTARKSLSET